MPNDHTAAHVIEMLQAAALDPRKLSEAIRALQAMVWKSKGWDDGLSGEVVEALLDLAYDLDFYEPDPTLRAEDDAFFAEDRAVREIAEALQRIIRG